MTEVAYVLRLLGGRLPDDESEAFRTCEAMNEVARDYGGASVDAWDYMFSSFDGAKNAASAFRRKGVVFDDFQIEAVDAGSGKGLSS